MVGLTSHLSDVSQGLTNKLGMYFYITETITGDALNTQVLALMKELDTAHISSEYLSQDDATQALKKRLPDIVTQFENYDIDAQLPSTLYISIRDEKEHKTLATLLPKYNSIITNLDDLGDGTSVRNQEQRVMKAIDFAQFLKQSSVVLIIIFIILMIGIVSLLIYFKLKQFEELLSLKKIVGASYGQMRSPFLVFVALVLLGWMMLSFAFTLLVALVNTGKTQSLVYFSQLLWLENMNTGIWWLLFNGYGTLLMIVSATALVIWIVSSLMVERKIRQLI